MRSQSLIILHSRNHSDSLRLRWTRSRDVTSLVQSDTFVRTGFLFHEALNEWDRLSMVDIEYTTMNTNHARSPQNLFQRYKYLPNTAIVILPPTPNNLQQFKAHTQYPKSKYLPNTAKIIPPLQLENSSNLISKIQITPSNHEVHRHAHPRSLCPQLVRPSHRSHLDHQGALQSWPNCAIEGEKRCWWNHDETYHVQFCDENKQWATFQTCGSSECEYQQRWVDFLGKSVYEPYCPGQGWNQAPWEHFGYEPAPLSKGEGE
jgi:hypothetical protein